MQIIIYAILALAIMGAIGTGVYKVKKWGGDEVRAEWSEANKKAEASARAKEAADRTIKEKADAENTASVARLNADVAKLRNERDRRNSTKLSAAPAGSKCPEGQACFDSASFESAYGELVADLRAKADECSAVTTDLDTAKKWAKGR